MPTIGASPAVLLGVTGLRIDGGIACVNRCVARVFAEEQAQRRLGHVDRVVLLDDPRAAAPQGPGDRQSLAGGSKLRFVLSVWRAVLQRRPDLVLFDHVGLARTVTLPFPGFPPARYAIFTHWYEIPRGRTRRHRQALEGARHLLANSHFSARALRDRMPRQAGRIHAVPLCIDPERTATWEAIGVPTADAPREPAVLIVARADSREREKGHETLLAAWPTVLETLPAARLWIVGDGDDLDYWNARARHHGVAAAVESTGKLDGVALSERYRRAAVFAMPSRQEGFGIVYAEAMWHGLPCIGSTADAAGELIADGETGLLVPYANPAATAHCLLRLLEDPRRARAMGAAGQRRLRERFSFEHFRAELLVGLGLDRTRREPGGFDA